MALFGSELSILFRLVQSLHAEKQRRPRVLCLGYPAILANAQTFANLDFPVAWDEVVKREDSEAAWRAHGLDMAGTGMCEAASLFDRMGANLWVMSDQPHTGPHVVHDLDYPIAGTLRRQLGEIDLIIDPGVLGGRFNIAQGFQNIDWLLPQQAIVYHQAVIASPNHAFWGISPTAFYDFYRTRGYFLGIPCLWAGQRDAYGFEPVLQEAMPYEAIPQYPAHFCGSFIFRKGVYASDDPGFPIQHCYSSRSRNLSFGDFVADALPATHLFRLNRN
ncbi:MAG: hypothetical protein JO171_16070 [Paludibacterium sp.]|uniref:hypothetical protein n=1 Tax=Paludibacterium sp. TaxID=1917523 RepID=UPI0025FCDCD4|nr:hypothetical protein [Paludibacterium sp.]MBV8048665.1 hypothetical protein [Paludibacterium sp.]MBV8645970.1 hypothetical protein [Paludibacterium sp.]